MSAAKPPATGPIAGSPPTLEWIGVERLSVDPTYQRATDGSRSRTIISGMVKAWDWRLCQPLAVSRRGDGALLVVDGQHRLEGARRRGDVAHLPCVVTSHSDAADEAATFVALNTRRQRLSQGEIFAASLATGDEGAHQALALLTRAGLSLAKNQDPTHWQPGQIFCGPAVQAAIKLYGETVASCALTALAEAYEGKVLSRGATILKALYVIYRDHAGEGFDPDIFIAALGSVDQLDWLGEAAVVRHGNPAMGTNESLIAAMLAEYRAQLAMQREAA